MVNQICTLFLIRCLLEKVMHQERLIAGGIKFLSGGCSTDPISLLKIAGVDMSTSKPIEQALSVFAGYLDPRPDTETH